MLPYLEGVGGHNKFYPVLRGEGGTTRRELGRGGGGTKHFRPVIFLFCSPPPPSP